MRFLITGTQPEMRRYTTAAGGHHINSTYQQHKANITPNCTSPAHPIGPAVAAKEARRLCRAFDFAWERLEQANLVATHWF
jgi:hypothetical protein